jgi:hypothetical protein
MTSDPTTSHGFVVGALMTKGTRFVLANTEELHAKIMDMSERIRQLENGLSASTAGSGPHPLLREDLLLVKIPIEFRNESNSPAQELPRANPPKEKDSMPTLLDAFGTLKIGSDGHSRFYGRTARTEVRWLNIYHLVPTNMPSQHFVKVSSHH